jgi:hypothetical protein
MADVKGDIRKKAIDALSIGDLSEEFRRQPASMARWGFMHARAADNVRQTDEALELAFSELYAEYREQDPDAKENDCKAYIRTSKKYQAAQRARRKAHYNSDVLKAAVKAFECKRDMLIQLGSDRRADFQSSVLSIGEKSKRQVNRTKRAEQLIRESFTGKREQKPKGR